MDSYAIGVDIGTGSTKAVAVTSQGEVIANAQVYYPGVKTQPGFAEQYPELIKQAFIKTIRQIIETVKEEPVVISLSSYMHSIMAVEEDGMPLTNIITWADTRSEAIAEEIRKSERAEELYQNTGTPIHSMSPLCKIAWLRQNDPEVFNRAAKFISIKEFLWFQLFGSFEVDYSIASATGLFHIEKLDWNEYSLQLSGITRGQLSDPVPVNHFRVDVDPEMAQMLGLTKETIFCIGGSDGCMANLGSQSVKPGIAALTIGTSGAVRIVSNEPVYNYDAMIFNYILDEQRFVCGGPVNNGGNVVQWLLKSFLKKDTMDSKDYSLLFDRVDQVPAGSKGLLFLPYLYGERAPIWDEKACGVYLGIRDHHTTDHFIRAAIEGVCYALLHVLQTLESATSEIFQLNISGGIVHSRIWMQMLADITGKQLSLLQREDASAIGAALMGMMSTDIISNETILQSDQEVIIKPSRKHRLVYNEMFSIYKKVYGNLKGSMHQLYDLRY
jgi:gluconokinase